jgi:nucleotide-binding universal stress UspA family protein
MYETVMWATDGSEGADAALEEALRLAELSGGRIVAVHCDQRLNGRAGGWPALADEDDRRLRIRGQVSELAADGVPIDLVVRRSHREAADVVAGVAEELAADVIVCGTRGLGAFSGAFLGSFTQRLLHIAPCPVLAVGPRALESVCLPHGEGAGIAAP